MVVRGLAECALLGALDLIAEEGGGVVEGYPHVPGGKKMSSFFLHNGTRTMYERCGFEFVRPKGLKNTVMRRVVIPRPAEATLRECRSGSPSSGLPPAAASTVTPPTKTRVPRLGRLLDPRRIIGTDPA